MKQIEREMKLNEVKEYVRKNYFNNDISQECLEAEDISILIAEFTKCAVSDLEWYTFKDVEDNLEYLSEVIQEIEFRYNETINSQVVLSDEDIEYISKQLSSNYKGISFNKNFNDLSYYDINTLLVLDEAYFEEMLTTCNEDVNIPSVIWSEIGIDREIIESSSVSTVGNKNSNRELQVFKIVSHAGNEMNYTTECVMMED